MNNYQAVTSVSKALLLGFLLYSNSLFADTSKAIEAFEKEEFNIAAELFLQAAEQGDIEAQARLGAMYFWGRGIRKNDVEAYSWSLKAAKQGHKVAEHTIGYFYQNGLYVNKDIHTAIDWYEKAAAQDYAPSIANLAGIYLWGEEMPLDIKRAITLAKSAAEKNDAYGQYLYGYIYENEYHDSRQAINWYTKSTINGNAAAANQIASIYYYGRGMEVNLKKAYYWFYISEEKGSVDAIANRKKMAKDITYDDRQSAEADAIEWLKKNKIQ